MKKFSFKPRTLDEAIVKDALCAVSTLDSKPETKDCFFVVGGVAVQSYLPTKCRRPTCDIDLAILRPLSYADFKNFSKLTQDYLKDNGYEIDLRKEHSSYHILFSKEGNAGVIEFARKSTNNFEDSAKRLDREFRNSRLKVIEGRASTCRFSSPEDIVVPKLVRDIGSLKRNRDLMNEMHTGNISPLVDADIKKYLKKIDELREQAIIHIGNPDLAERLRFVQDTYDIRILSGVVGFNKDYLENAMSEWNVLNEHSLERDTLVYSLLPSLDS